MTQTTGRTRKQQEREMRVIEAAMRLAADGGYEAVQMREVAARADVALGTIYRYFSSKDAVLVAGMAGWVGLARKSVATEGIVADTPADQLVAVLDSAVRSSTRQPTLMAALITALASTEPEVAEHKLEVEQEMNAMISDALGGFEGIDVEGVSRVIGHVWFSSILSWVAGMRPAESIMDELTVAAHLLLD
ncbi:MAG: TetR family transcriptional regulator [Acidimicrobiales bacterium]